jgi:serralysin
MANYIFEQMTDAQAAAYDPASDDLYFLNGSPATVQVQYNEAAGLQVASLTLTNGSVSHTFGADALAGEHLTFFGGSSDDVLSFGADSVGSAATLSGVVGAGSRYYALGGADTVTGSVANDTIFGGDGNDSIVGSSSHQNTAGDYTESDYLNGGGGGDTITGGDGNDHIYGSDQFAVAGSVDGADSLSGGNGVDYIQGNAGNDTIDGGAGADKLYGGAGNDSVTGGTEADYLQGNKGADTLDGGADNDVIHGGADNDSLIGGAGNDWLYGDAGNDAVHGGMGYDTVEGGVGVDTFFFAAGEDDIANLTSASTAAHHGQLDTISDFTHGTDLLSLTFAPAAAANVGTSATNFASVDDAYIYAQTQLTGHGSNVEVLQVGTDSVLFYDSAHTTGTIDSAVLLHGVTASTITFHDFV